MLRGLSHDGKGPTRRHLFQRAFGWSASAAGVWLTRQPAAAAPVLLLTSDVAGTAYGDVGLIRNRLRPGPATLGYVPRRDNQAAAPLMDAGRVLTARLAQVGREGFDVELKVELVG